MTSRAVASQIRAGQSPRLPAGAALALLTLAAAGPARSGEYCVSCSGPEAHYRCTLEGGAMAGADPGARLLCITTLAKDGGHASCSIDRKSAPPCPGDLKIIAAPQGYAPDTGPAAEARPEGTPADGARGTQRAVSGNAAAAPGPSAPQTGQAVEAAGEGPTTEPPQASQNAGNGKWGDQSGAAGAEQPPGETGAADPSPVDAVVKPIEKAGEAVGEAAKTAGTAVEKAGSTLGNAAKKTWKCLASLFGDC